MKKFVPLLAALLVLTLTGATVNALAVAGLVIRLWRSRGVERQQLKWFAYACAPLISGILGITLLEAWTIGVLMSLLGFGLFPIVTGIAVLRHRLYDLDVVINRTLVYASLTVSLALLYYGGVPAT